MFWFACLTLGKYGRMFNQPELLLCVSGALVGEIGHCLPAADVILLAEIDHIQSLRQFTSPF